MSTFQEQVMNRLSSLTQALNNISTLSKSIDNLDEVTQYTDNMYLVVHDPSSGKAVKFPFTENSFLGSEYFIEISSNKFTLKKHPNNTSLATLEVNDMVCDGWWSDTEFWRLAVYVGGETTNAASWNVIDTIEEIPLN